MISPSQRPLPDNTQHSQQTNIHAPGGDPMIFTIENYLELNIFVACVWYLMSKLYVHSLTKFSLLRSVEHIFSLATCFGSLFR